MSARGGRRRGRPPKAAYIPPRFLNARSSIIEKPKWLLTREGSDSTGNYTPSISRASSPGGSVNSFSQYSAKKHISVTPFKKRGRKAGTRGNRGGKAYVPRPSLVITRDSDYHYGSDFDSASDSEQSPGEADIDEQIESDVDIPDSDPEANSNNCDDDDSDFSLSNQSTVVRKTDSFKNIPTPLPLWLQEAEIPKLHIPSSSEDLLLPSHQVLPACAIFEVLRKFSTEVRLSPFRVEDFMAALQSEEMTSLLAEIHVMLLKALLREEDAQQTWFGPLDQKDSTNSMLYFSDTLTWPEVLRVYLQSDRIFSDALELLNSCEYPFTSCEVRLQMLKFLTDQFLCTTSVRQDILSEGNIRYDDHCRVCYKVGDLLCCETCPAVYHLHCLDPPLEQVPNEDWQCPVCVAQHCKGVTDCVSDLEKSGLLCRQDCLGYDRHGRKYWFICRRIFVEEGEGLEISTEESMSPGGKKVWYYSTPSQFSRMVETLDSQNYERDLCRELHNLRPEIIRQMTITEQLTNEFKGSNKSYFDAEEVTLKELKDEKFMLENESEKEAQIDVGTEEDKKDQLITKEEPQEMVEECGVEVDDDFMQQLTVESELKDEDKPSVEGTSSYATRSKTGSIVVRNYADGKKRPLIDGGGVVIKEEEVKENVPFPPDVIFKLGMEGVYKDYVNQYSTNSTALNKNQAAEERDRKRYLSHKFSLTGAGEFKWVGSTFGNKTTMLHTLRATLLQLHSQLLGTFMHPNWTLMRKPWIAAVNACVSPRDLGRALSVLAACIRPVVFTSVWQESLGHVRLQRQTAMEREDKKKLDKKDKKEKELEEEMHRLHTIHYTLGLKHQIWKQKGEEYRLHGQWGWRWLSSTRPIRRQDARQCGLRSGPWRIIIRVQSDDESRFVQADPATGEIYKVPITDPALELVDISAGLTDSDRRLYPKLAKKGKLDGLLDWRLKLKAIEEKQMANISTDMSASKKEKEDADVDVEGEEEGKEKEANLPEVEKLRALHERYRCYSLQCGERCYSPTCRTILSQSKQPKKEIVQEPVIDVKKVDSVNQKKVYSVTSTHGPISLKRILSDEERAKKKRVPVKYPMMSTYMTKSKKRTIFVLPDHELRHLARRGAHAYVTGFHHGAKTNSIAWPYPSPRPLFKTCWFFRTTGLQSLSAAALQLRILWSCLRWEDMGTKPSTADGKNQLTTDTEIITTEILKHRHVGRFLEKTQYFQRRVVIPLDVPKTVREVTPSRLGLRKRKLVEAPQLSQPIVSEEWVDEDKLDLWEIRHYHERMERVTTPILTRLKAAPQTVTVGNAVKSSGLSMEELKEKAEQQLRAQRAAHQQKKAEGSVSAPGTPAVVRLAVPVSKVAIPASTVSGTKSTLAALISSPTASSVTPTAVQRRILVTKDGSSLIKTATGSSQPVLLAAPSPAVTPQAAGAANKIQITRGADGKIQIRGLQPGQQLMRLSDGRFTIVSTNVVQQQPVVAEAKGSTEPAAKTVLLKPGTTSLPAKPPGQMVVSGNTASLVQQIASGKLQLATINGQQVLLQSSTPAIVTSSQTTVVGAKLEPNTTTAATTSTKQALVLQSPQGSRIVVQNLQGGSLTPQQISAIQEQLKSQILRVQVNKPGTPATVSVAAKPVVGTAQAAGAAPGTPVNPTRSPDKSKFVVTPDFIQQTIRKALKQENLHPDIEQKLLQLQRFQEKQKRRDGLEEETTSSTRKRTLSDTSWSEEMEAPKPAKKLTRVVEPPVVTATPIGRPTVSNEEREQKAKERSMKAQQRARERRMQQQQSRLQGLMARHAELLKKDMLRKRALLEKELRLTIQRELSATKIPSPTRTPAPATIERTPPPVKEKESPPRSQKRKAAAEKQSPSPVAPAAKKQRTVSSSKGSNKKKLYCICRTPYDNSKFYVGCDLCSNWFHGECVGITESMSQTMSEFICEGCSKARSTQELFCLCRQPYDESQFYICCDRCQDWFHGRCVGVLQSESESIDEYTCPRCDPNLPFNYSNMKTLGTRDYEELRKLLRQLQTHKSSWPFREPVNPREAPDYYRVIKEPMDLRAIETKIQERRYQQLSEFIGDVTKIFDNCRYYNAKESSIARSATTLESFFVPRLRILRDSMANN